jgi:hypothetical protein
MKRFLIAVLAFIALTPAASGQTTTRSFTNGNGSFVGSSATRGNSTSFTDGRGSFAGSAIRNSNGTTSTYDRNGHFTGSVVNTGPQR